MVCGRRTFFQRWICASTISIGFPFRRRGPTAGTGSRKATPNATLSRTEDIGRDYSPVAGRLMTIPGEGSIAATAITALGPAARSFRAGRNFAGRLGLTPLRERLPAGTRGCIKAVFL
jgi:hypothetical protein